MHFLRTKPPIRPSFKQNVAAFWAWYADRAEHFRQVIDDGRCAELSGEVGPAVDHYLHCLAWEFGPPPEGQPGHSFTLSPEGNSHRRFLTEYCVRRAPELPGWTFYPCRQASPKLDPSVSIKMHGHALQAGEIWVTPHPQQDLQVVNLSAWHPVFPELPEKAAYQTLFILLDDALGEDVVENHIGDIHIRDTKLKDSVPLHELRDEVRKIREKWPDVTTGNELYHGYKLPEPSNEYLRADTIAGSTRHHRLINEYLGSSGQMNDDPLEGSGAKMVFLAFPTERLPPGEEAQRRGEYEEALDQRLRADHSGEVLGGACGFTFSYIDLALYDTGPDTLRLIQEVLQPLNLTPGTAMLHPFFAANGKPWKQW